MPQEPKPPAEGCVVPFPWRGGKPRAGVTWLAVAIVLGRAIVAAARIVVPIALLLLAAVGLLRILGY